MKQFNNVMKVFWLVKDVLSKSSNFKHNDLAATATAIGIRPNPFGAELRDFDRASSVKSSGRRAPPADRRKPAIGFRVEEETVIACGTNPPVFPAATHALGAPCDLEILSPLENGRIFWGYSSN